MYDELVKALRETRERVKSNPNVAMFVPPYQLSAAADAIEKLSTPKWIPVTERMPEEGKYVLVYGKELRPNPHASQIEVSEVYDGNYWSGFGRTKKITHWMPLPEPPKEEARA